MTGVLSFTKHVIKWLNSLDVICLISRDVNKATDSKAKAKAKA